MSSGDIPFMTITVFPVKMLSREFRFSLLDRLLEHTEQVVDNLPELPDPESDEIYDDLIEYQDAFQEGGRELLPDMETVSHIILEGDFADALSMMEKLARSQPMMIYWGYMCQHTSIEQFRERLGE